jgi:hypothetical protein
MTAKAGRRHGGSGRHRFARSARPWRPGPFSFLACAVLASLADLQADGPAPSWLVRVGTCLALHFPGGNHRLCLDRPGLLIWELGRRLFAIVPGPAANQTHSGAKQTHGVIIGRRLAGFSHLGLRRRSAGGSKCVSCLPEAAGRVARLRVPLCPAGRPPLPPPRRGLVPPTAPALGMAPSALFRSRPAAASSLPIMHCKAPSGRLTCPASVRTGSESGRPARSPRTRSPSVARCGTRSTAVVLATVR